MQRKPVDAIIIGAYFSTCGVWGIIKYFMDDPAAKMSKYAGKQLGFSLESIVIILIVIGTAGAICSAINVIGGICILNLKSWARKLLNINFCIQVSLITVGFFTVSFIALGHLFTIDTFPVLIAALIAILILSIPIFYINTPRFKSLLE